MVVGFVALEAGERLHEEDEDYGEEDDREGDREGDPDVAEITGVVLGAQGGKRGVGGGAEDLLGVQV